MSALSPILRSLEGGSVLFFCPGCKTAHQVRVSSPQSNWGYNGNPDTPTFTPSILVRSGHYASGGGPGNCYCNWSERFPDREPMPYKCIQCHSFVTDGQIQFLSDCTHELAGQTVPLPVFPGYTE